MLPVKRADRTKVTDPSKRRAPKQERSLAAKLGGRTTSASGSKSEKGDVRVKGVLRVEAKCTRKKSFSVTLEMIEKITNAATLTADVEIPAMHVEFLDPNGARLVGLYVVREDDFEEMIRKVADAHTSNAGLERERDKG
jgi:hypothetical protein